MDRKVCCVKNCKSTSQTNKLFCIPKDDKLRSLWMQFLIPYNSDLLLVPKEKLVRKRVCDRHFDFEQFDQNGKRHRWSYPCLFTEDEIAHGVPLSSKEWSVLEEHSYGKAKDADDAANSSSSVMVMNSDSNEHFVGFPNLQGDKSIQPDTGEIVTKEQSLDFPALHRLNEDCITTEQSSSSIGITHGENIPHFIEEIVIEDMTTTPSNVTQSCETTGTATTSRSEDILDASSVVRKKVPLKRKLWSKERKFVQQVEEVAKNSLGKSAAERLSEAQKTAEKEIFFENYNLLSKQAKTFLFMQLKNVRKNKNSRRFTLEEKILALSILKHGARNFKLLEHMFALPSKRTLSRLAANICFEPGINKKTFEHISTSVQHWPNKKKLCSIAFDEVSLTPHLTFNESKDIIDGFVTLEERKLKLCDHALVFMIRGICSSWRQCIAYYFCEGTVPAQELKTILRKVVNEVGQTGLIPLALICDQGSTFRTAFRSLRQETAQIRTRQGLNDDGTVHISGHNLHLIYDPPHLLKGMRNNFVTKNVKFENGKIATWKDILHIFDLDSKLGNNRALPKLTEHHVDPNKIKKMKVSVAAQVLSARTAAMLKYTDECEKLHCPNKISTLSTTADFVEFVDNLFDSVNGRPGSSQRGKMRKAVKPSSNHIPYWHEAIRVLQKMRFIDETSKNAIKAGKALEVRVPSLEGWIVTLKSFINLSNKLFSEYGVEYFYPRYLNQDPLENFFGRIRSYNFRNINPDAYTFKNSFKSLVLSNVLSPLSKFTNCEKDDGEAILDLNFLFSQDSDANKENQENTLNLQTNTPSSNTNLSEQVFLEKIRVQCSAYTAGFICRKLTKHNNCKMCIKSYTTKELSALHKFIQMREYKTLKKPNLVYPNERFTIIYRNAAEFIHSYLNSACHTSNIGKQLTELLHDKLSLSGLGCKKHKTIVRKKFISLVIRLHVHNWCKIMNKILKGDVHERHVMNMGIPQKLAFHKYRANKLRGKKNK